MTFHSKTLRHFITNLAQWKRKDEGATNENLVESAKECIVARDQCIRRGEGIISENPPLEGLSKNQSYLS